jgi:hypothetical protein
LTIVGGNVLRKLSLPNFDLIQLLDKIYHFHVCDNILVSSQNEYLHKDGDINIKESLIDKREIFYCSYYDFKLMNNNQMDFFILNIDSLYKSKLKEKGYWNPWKTSEIRILSFDKRRNIVLYYYNDGSNREVQLYNINEEKNYHIYSLPKRSGIDIGGIIHTVFYQSLKIFYSNGFIFYRDIGKNYSKHRSWHIVELKLIFISRILI